MNNPSRFLAGIFLSLLVIVPAVAQNQSKNVTDIVTALTVTTAGTICLNANGNRRSLTLDSTNAAANIGYCETVGTTQCTPSIGGATSTQLASGSIYFWPAGTAPTNQICFIVGSGTQPVIAREGQ